MLNLLNTKASTELQSGLIEEAEETATQAINYYLATYSATANQEPTQYGDRLLQCQAQVSALILRKIGVSYKELGKQRDDEGLVKTGNDLIVRSSQILKLCRNNDVRLEQASPERRVHDPADKESR